MVGRGKRGRERGGAIHPGAGELALELETGLLVNPVRIPINENLRKVILKGLQDRGEPQSAPTLYHSSQTKPGPQDGHLPVRGGFFERAYRYALPRLDVRSGDFVLGLFNLTLHLGTGVYRRTQNEGEFPFCSDLDNLGRFYTINQATEPFFLDKVTPPPTGKGGERDRNASEQLTYGECGQEPRRVCETKLPAEVKEGGCEGSDWFFPRIRSQKSEAKLMDHPTFIVTVGL
jgi:hypothetical protein